MIKVDIISGFLGAGKTTLIKLLAKAANEKGERVVIIENEFGEIGIDGKVLELEGLEVFEITSGCLCCSVKSDFIATLLMVANEIHPDRILIEPSGIFVPADVLDLFKTPGMEKIMRINSLINVLDSLHYLKQRVKYGFFFENQLRYAKQVVMSKTGTLSDETLLIIRSEIQKINPSLPVFTKEWDRMSSEELLLLISPDLTPDGSEKAAVFAEADRVSRTNRQEEIKNSQNYKKRDSMASLPYKKITHPQKSHEKFVSYSFTPEKRFTEESLRQSLENFSTAEYGKILRAKGFVNSKENEDLLEFDYVNQSVDIARVRKSFEPSVYFIGENLDKEAIALLF